MATQYVSTNRQAPEVSFSQALIKGQAPDLGLYTPKDIPKFEPGELEQLQNLEYYETAYEVVRKYVKDEIEDEKLREICKKAYDFDVPIEKAFDRTYVLRLDRGPTASFKDFAARLMARLMEHILSESGNNLIILTATSGDTGSAVANAFYGLKNIEVMVLFPEGEVTGRQRKQMTTLKGNVKTIEVSGKFDDCQALVKKAFADPELESLNLSSANSINIGRLIPQSVYYIYSYLKHAEKMGEPITFSVPSGNFGDLMGGLLAWKMGLPVDRFIVATNSNDEFPTFLETGSYTPLHPSKACISNAMNVGHPSNLARLVHLFGGWMDEKGQLKEMPDMDKMRDILWSTSVSDDQTRQAIKNAYESQSMLLEPHGAVGWHALMKYQKTVGGSYSISLETADPAKFPDEIVAAVGVEPELPASLKGLDDLEEHGQKAPADYDSIKKLLIENY